MKSFEVTVNSKTPDGSVAELTRCLESVFNKSIEHRASAGKTPSLLIALSGGIDSVVLLSLADQLQKIHGCTLRAVYVDHGLQQHSGQWGEHCAALCQTRSISFSIEPVEVDLQSGLSPEAAARDARYAAFEKLLEDNEYLCTAHHADDQAETLLLQLLRGAGTNGLAAMPELRRFGSGFLLRPLLQVSQAEIQAYAIRHQLSWCDDPSNNNLDFDRNYLRHELLPRLQKRWPNAVKNMTRSANHCAEAVALANDLALQDSSHSVVDAADQSIAAQMPPQLSVRHLQSLSYLRQKNLLRNWIRHHGYQMPSTVQLQQILKDLVVDNGQGHGRVNFGRASVARYQDALYVDDRDQFDPLPDFEYQWCCSEPPLLIRELGWQLDASCHPKLLPFIGKPLVVRNRRGGERWRRDAAGHSVSVKSLLQQKNIPPWHRSRLVFVFHRDLLVDICGPDFVL